ncbi:MAG: hypothetical protein JWM36_3172 [Hyphomicrobiales bacterium]|nr:hypothetical protein [Hyphomicrobiales bacterium]
MGMPTRDGWVPGPDYKPRWKVELEAAQDSRWLEAGTYQITCTLCGKISTIELAKTNRPRVSCKCPKCRKKTIL